MEYTTVCTGCGKPFKTHTTLTRYCSEKCKRDYRKASKEPNTTKDMADLATEINAMPDFIEDLNGAEVITEQPDIEVDIPILTFTQPKPAPAPAPAPAAKPKPNPNPKPKPVRSEPSLDLTTFVTFADGLKLFTSIIRNNAINPETRNSFLFKLQEATTLHPSLSPNQIGAIYDRISNYRSGSYIDKKTNIHRL